MVEKVSADFSQWDKVFDRLAGPARESLARRMCVSGGQVIRDEAKQLAPISDPPYNPTSRGSQRPGSLRDSIYLAFNTTLSNNVSFTYTVSWPKTAFWGIFIEFGWTQVHPIIRGKDGFFYTDTSRKLPNPIRHAAKPFLRPAFDASQQRAYAAMLARGREELPKLLRGEQ